MLRGNPPLGAGPCVDVRRPPAADEPQVDVADVVGVSQLASGVLASGIQALGSTAVSNIVAGRLDRTLCADKYGGQAGDYWRRDKVTSYPGIVPREVLAPNGAARGTRQSPSGILVLAVPRASLQVLSLLRPALPAHPA